MGTRQAYDKELYNLKQELLRMGSLVEEMIHQSIEALANQDKELANKVIVGDDVVDAMERELDEQCVRLIALQQPLARDLRVVVTVTKVVTDLERIADHAVNIAETALKIADQPLIKPLVDIPRMAKMAKAMVKGCLDAFVNGDVDLARSTAMTDDQVDRLYDMLFTELIDIAARSNDTTVSTQAINLLFVARYLERVADHATNVAERVIFMVTGKREKY